MFEFDEEASVDDSDEDAEENLAAWEETHKVFLSVFDGEVVRETEHEAVGEVVDGAFG